MVLVLCRRGHVRVGGCASCVLPPVTDVPPSLPEARTGPAPAETPDMYGAFPRLTDEQLATLVARGAREAVRKGDVLYREGDTTCDCYVILCGLVAIVEDYGSGDQVIGMHGHR